eukprot:sb/3469461/
MKFLDKFVFKNPKKNIKAANKKFYNRNKATAEQPQVYSKDFRSQSENKINADEQFFYQYFKESASNTKSDQELDFADDIKLGAGTDKKKKAKKGEEDEDEDDDDGSEFSYGEMEDGSGDEEKLGDKAYEKFLWENLDSDGESLQGDEDGDSEGDGDNSDVMGSDVMGSDEEMMDGEGEEDGGWEELDVGELSEEDEELVETEKMKVEKSKKKGKKTTGKKDKKKKKKDV